MKKSSEIKPPLVLLTKGLDYGSIPLATIDQTVDQTTKETNTIILLDYLT